MHVLITGGSSGIGEAIAYRYARRGAAVALFARRRERLEAVAARCRALGAAGARVLPGDTTQPAEVAAAARALLDEWPAIDRAFLNAGGGNAGRDAWHALDCCTGDALRATAFSAQAAVDLMQLNYLGVVWWLEPLLRHMAARRDGTIAVTGSMAADGLLPRSGPYTATKMALRGLVDGLRLDSSAAGVRLCLIEPAFVASEQTGNERALPFLLSSEAAAARIVDGVERGEPLVRLPWQMSWINRMCAVLPKSVYRRWAAQRLRSAR
jgi:NADP-dependent 3-hydroxy acid dehydrogenase YdfG